jgi:cytochrome P450
MPHTIDQWELLRATPAIMRNPLNFLLESAEKYGPVVPIAAGNIHALLVSHPDAVRHVLQTNARNYTKQTIQFDTFRLVAGNGLLNSDGDLWFSQRRLIQPAFHRRQLEQFAHVMHEAAVQLAHRWQHDPRYRAPIEMEHEMMAFSLPVICRALFSHDMDNEREPLLHAVNDALDYVMWRARVMVPVPMGLPLPQNRRYRRALALIDRFVTRLVAERRQMADPPPDLLSLILFTRDADTGETMPDHLVRDEIVTLIVAGYETVATAMTWLWYLLDRHPAVTTRLHAELDRELGGRPPHLADLPRLPLLNGVLQESLRLYPPSWVISRRAVSADTVLNTPIPAGTTVIISPYVVHRQAEFWPDPERFDPDRFTPASNPADRFAFIPFGGGPRLCIGNRFAELEAQLLIGTLAQQFSPRLTISRAIATKPLVTIRPRDGLWMQVQKRGL